MRWQFIAALMLALCTALGVKWFESHQLAQDLTQASGRNQTLSEKLDRATGDLERIRKAERERLQDRAQLQKKQTDLQLLADSRMQTIRNLNHEIEELRRWAAEPLPDAVVRLYERPGFQSAADYLEYLRHTNTLHTASDEPQK